MTGCQGSLSLSAALAWEGTAILQPSLLLFHTSETRQGVPSFCVECRIDGPLWGSADIARTAVEPVGCS